MTNESQDSRAGGVMDVAEHVERFDELGQVIDRAVALIGVHHDRAETALIDASIEVQFSGIPGYLKRHRIAWNLAAASGMARNHPEYARKYCEAVAFEIRLLAGGDNLGLSG